MAVVDSAETYASGVLVERRALNDDGTVSVFDGAGALTATVPASPTSLARVAAAVKRANEAQIRQALKDAITDNVATLATVTAGLNIATGLKTTTVANLADAQARIRQCGTVLEGLVNAQAASTQQLTKLARLLTNQLDGTT